MGGTTSPTIHACANKDGVVLTASIDGAKIQTICNKKSLYSAYCSAYIGIVRDYKRLILKDLVDFVLPFHIADYLSTFPPRLGEFVILPKDSERFPFVAQP